MKRFTIPAAVAGLILFGILLAASGAEEVWDAVQAAGWATALVVLLRAVAIAGGGVAWHVLSPPGGWLPVRLCILLRFVREAANQLLPVAAIGGDFIGARLATFWGCGAGRAGASVIADVGIQAATQLAFAVMGLALLVALVGNSELVHYAAAGLAVAALGIGAFVFLQRREGSELLLRIGRRVAGGRDWAGFGAVERVYARLGEIYAHPGRVAVSAVTHLAIWVFGALEVWVVLDFMGHPVTFAEAVVIESLGQAVRGAAFAVPGGLGVQEGGYIALCALFGVPAGPALALSLVKRVADVALGLPFLLVWQVQESRRALAAETTR